MAHPYFCDAEDSLRSALLLHMFDKSARTAQDELINNLNALSDPIYKEITTANEDSESLEYIK